MNFSFKENLRLMLPVVRRSVDFSFESNSMLMLGWGGVEWGGERGGWREDRERNRWMAY